MFEFIGYFTETINVNPCDNSFVIKKIDNDTYHVLMKKPFSNNHKFIYNINDKNLDIRYIINNKDIIYKDINYVFNNINNYIKNETKELKLKDAYFKKNSRYYMGYNSKIYTIEMDVHLNKIYNNIIYDR